MKKIKKIKIAHKIIYVIILIQKLNKNKISETIIK